MSISKLVGDQYMPANSLVSSKVNLISGPVTRVPSSQSKLSSIYNYEGNGFGGKSGFLGRPVTSDSLANVAKLNLKPKHDGAHRAVLVACDATQRCAGLNLSGHDHSHEVVASTWTRDEVEKLKNDVSGYKRDIKDSDGEIGILWSFTDSLKNAGIIDDKSTITPAGEAKLKLMNETSLPPEVRLAMLPIGITHDDGSKYKYPLLVVLDLASKQGEGLSINQAYIKENTPEERMELEVGIAKLLGLSADFDRKAAYRKLIEGMRLPEVVKSIPDTMR